MHSTKNGIQDTLKELLGEENSSVSDLCVEGSIDNQCVMKAMSIHTSTDIKIRLQAENTQDISSLKVLGRKLDERLLDKILNAESGKESDKILKELDKILNAESGRESDKILNAESGKESDKILKWKMHGIIYNKNAYLKLSVQVIVYCACQGCYNAKLVGYLYNADKMNNDSCKIEMSGSFFLEEKKNEYTISVLLSSDMKVVRDDKIYRNNIIAFDIDDYIAKLPEEVNKKMMKLRINELKQRTINKGTHPASSHTKEYTSTSTEPSHGRKKYAQTSTEPNSKKSKYASTSTEPNSKKSKYASTSTEPNSKKSKYAQTSTEPNSKKRKYAQTSTEPNSKKRKYAQTSTEPNSKKSKYASTSTEPSHDSRKRTLAMREEHKASGYHDESIYSDEDRNEFSLHLKKRKLNESATKRFKVFTPSSAQRTNNSFERMKRNSKRNLSCFIFSILKLTDDPKGRDLKHKSQCPSKRRNKFRGETRCLICLHRMISKEHDNCVLLILCERYNVVNKGSLKLNKKELLSFLCELNSSDTLLSLRNQSIKMLDVYAKVRSFVKSAIMVIKGEYVHDNAIIGCKSTDILQNTITKLCYVRKMTANFIYVINLFLRQAAKHIDMDAGEIRFIDLESEEFKEIDLSYSSKTETTLSYVEVKNIIKVARSYLEVMKQFILPKILQIIPDELKEKTMDINNGKQDISLLLNKDIYLIMKKKLATHIRECLTFDEFMMNIAKITEFINHEISSVSQSESMNSSTKMEARTTPRLSTLAERKSIYHSRSPDTESDTSYSNLFDEDRKKVMRTRTMSSTIAKQPYAESDISDSDLSDAEPARMKTSTTPRSNTLAKRKSIYHFKSSDTESDISDSDLSDEEPTEMKTRITPRLSTLAERKSIYHSRSPDTESDTSYSDLSDEDKATKKVTKPRLGKHKRSQCSDKNMKHTLSSDDDDRKLIVKIPYKDKVFHDRRFFQPYEPTHEREEQSSKIKKRPISSHNAAGVVFEQKKRKPIKSRKQNTKKDSMYSQSTREKKLRQNKPKDKNSIFYKTAKISRHHAIFKNHKCANISPDGKYISSRRKCIVCLYRLINLKRSYCTLSNICTKYLSLSRSDIEMLRHLNELKKEDSLDDIQTKIKKILPVVILIQDCSRIIDCILKNKYCTNREYMRKIGLSGGMCSNIVVHLDSLQYIFINCNRLIQILCDIASEDNLLIESTTLKDLKSKLEQLTSIPAVMHKAIVSLIGELGIYLAIMDHLLIPSLLEIIAGELKKSTKDITISKLSEILDGTLFTKLMNAFKQIGRHGNSEKVSYKLFYKELNKHITEYNKSKDKYVLKDTITAFMAKKPPQTLERSSSSMEYSDISEEEKEPPGHLTAQCDVKEGYQYLSDVSDEEGLNFHTP